MISLERLQSVLARFPGLSIGLVGDLFVIIPELTTKIKKL